MLPDLACRGLSPFYKFSDSGMSELFCNRYRKEGEGGGGGQGIEIKTLTRNAASLELVVT